LMYAEGAACHAALFLWDGNLPGLYALVFLLKKLTQQD